MIDKKNKKPDTLDIAFYGNEEDCLFCPSDVTVLS